MINMKFKGPNVAADHSTVGRGGRIQTSSSSATTPTPASTVGRGKEDLNIIIIGDNTNTCLGWALRKGYEVGRPRIKDANMAVRYNRRIGIINQSFRVDWTRAGEDRDAVAAHGRIEMEKKEAYRSCYGQRPRSSRTR